MSAAYGLPLGTWRVCGRSLDDGCACGPHGPSQADVSAALERQQSEVAA